MKNLNYIDINIINKNLQLLYLYYLISINKFIIFIEYNKLFDFQKLNISLENIKCFVLNSFYIKNIFSYNFYFLGSNLISIYIKTKDTFYNILKLVENRKIFLSFNYSLSSYIDTKVIFNYLVNTNFNFLHYIVFRLVYNIIILIFLFLVSIVKYIK